MTITIKLRALFSSYICHQPDVKLGRFRSQLGASHTGELLYNETICLWMTIYIYIYIYIYNLP